QPGVLVQTVMKPAVFVHCQGLSSTALSTGVGWASLTEANAAPDASTTIAATSAIRRRFHKLQFRFRIMIPCSHCDATKIGAAASSSCDRDHNFVRAAGHDSLKRRTYAWIVQARSGRAAAIYERPMAANIKD